MASLGAGSDCGKYLVHVVAFTVDFSAIAALKQDPQL